MGSPLLSQVRTDTIKNVVFFFSNTLFFLIASFPDHCLLLPFLTNSITFS